MSKRALIILASKGAEEMEVIITGDVLERGGIHVDYAGLDGTQPVDCARKARIVPSIAFDSAQNDAYDIVILPGGQPGSTTLAETPKVGDLLKTQAAAGKWIGAICAAPIALLSHGIKTEVLTSHPSVRDQLVKGGYNYSEERVVVSGKVITSRGPGTAFEFALRIVEILEGSEKANSLISPMLLKL